MNWEAVGAVSEAIGVVTILISLVYLTVHIRHLSLQHDPDEPDLPGCVAASETRTEVVALSGADDLSCPLHDATYAW
jgi:hypothetical protein